MQYRQLPKSLLFLPIQPRSYNPRFRRQSGSSGGIWTVWFCTAGKIGQQTARFQHFDSRIPMAGRIDTIQAMRQHSNSRKSVVQSVPVGTDIDAVSQSTHDQQVRDHFCQVFYKGFGKLPTIFGRVASTHNTDDTGRIKVSISLKIEKYRGIRTFSQAHRIICISQIITGNIVFSIKANSFPPVARFPGV